MGQATMSNQSPQTGGKTGQYGQPGQAGGKGMAGGMMNAASNPQQMQQSMPQQADGNSQMGVPLPPMGGPMQQTNSQQPVGASGSAGAIGQGMGQGNVTYPSQSGQPMMGMPNQYSNTVGQFGQGMEEGSAYQGTGSGKNASSGKGAGNSSRSSGA